MRVLELWRYPIKSVGGERLDTATVTTLGIDGDRGWGLALKTLDGSMDVAAGGLFTLLQRLKLLSEAYKGHCDDNILKQVFASSGVGTIILSKTFYLTAR